MYISAYVGGIDSAKSVWPSVGYQILAYHEQIKFILNVALNDNLT